METNNDVAYVPRERKSVPILGIDRSTPDDLVEDGKCAELNNLRYKDGAWRAVKDFEAKHIATLDPNYEICYHHPAAGEFMFIVRDKATKRNYNAIDLTYPSTAPKLQPITQTSSEATLSHFGNILVFNDKVSAQRHFIFKDGKYTPIDVYNIYPLTLFNSTTMEEVHPDEIRLYSAYDSKLYWRWEDIPTGLMDAINKGTMKVRSSTFNFFNASNGTPISTRKSEKWRGEIMIFAIRSQWL